MSGDLTTNFSYNEFRPNGAGTAWKPSFPLQNLMIKILANNIQMVINQFPGSHLYISSGVRTASDYDRLVQEGYHPSPISDHYAGNIVPIDLINHYDNYCQFGPYYTFSVGAADTNPTVNIMDFFKAAIDLNKRGITNFGQIIHEIHPEKKQEWIHLANNLNIFYTSRIIGLIPLRPPYQFTIDGGQTYHDYIG